jgi:hypothetical protein
MRSRRGYVEHALTPLDVELLRALVGRGNEWPGTARLTADVQLDPTDPRDRTRALAALSHLRRRGYVAYWRPDFARSARWTLTTTGEAKLAELDQLTLA